MELDLTNLQKAIVSLEHSINAFSDESFMANMTPMQKNLIRAGVIQNFEFTYELCWKFMVRWLEKNLNPSIAVGLFRKELFRLAGERGLITDFARWVRYNDSRNIVSHAYDEDIASQILELTPMFLDDAKNLLTTLEQHND